MAIKATKVLTIGRHKAWRASLGTVDAVRPTKSEAIYALCDQIEAILDGTYNPEVLSFGPYVTVVYRDITGWCYRVDSVPVKALASSTASLGAAGRAEAVTRARRHMVQMAYPIAGLAYLESAGDLDGVLSQAHWLGFQRAYSTAKHRAIESGGDVNEAEWHRIACAHADDPDLIERDERVIIERVRSRIASGS